MERQRKTRAEAWRAELARRNGEVVAGQASTPPVAAQSVAAESVPAPTSPPKRK